MTMKRTLRSSMAAAGILVSLTALTVLQSVPLQVSAPALTGRVTSASESAMEGVLVSAEREGSNMTITVISNASGVYAFPQDRLQPGRYDVTIRAAGYILPAAKVVDITPKTTTVDLRLEQASILDKLFI
jgi:virginiamycin B lyase